MKTVYDYSDLPENAAYIGGSCPDGSIYLSTLDAIERAIEPICLVDHDDGTRHYFDLAVELN
jgi:hypothetical protein